MNIIFGESVLKSLCYRKIVKSTRQAVIYKHNVNYTITADKNFISLKVSFGYICESQIRNLNLNIIKMGKFTKGYFSLYDQTRIMFLGTHLFAVVDIDSHHFL